MSSKAYSKLEGIKSDLTAQGVEVENIHDLVMLLLGEMRSSNVKLAFGIGAGGAFLGIIIGLLIPLLVLH